jgi:hypothetical protein
MVSMIPSSSQTPSRLGPCHWGQSWQLAAAVKNKPLKMMKVNEKENQLVGLIELDIHVAPDVRGKRWFSFSNMPRTIKTAGF